MGQNQTYSPDHMDSPKAWYPTNTILDNKKAPTLEGGYYKKIGGMWNIKHEISSPKFYKILVNTWLKVDTALELNKFYNDINMCLILVTRLQEDFLPAYQYIKRHSEFEE